jgi:ATP-dependent helicase Lhr and Lhr-like helicase
MTALRPSSSEQTSSAAFDAYDERLRRWIWRRQWGSLRDIQEQACAPILAAEDDVIIASATASGKTEAALLPALTRIAADPQPGLRLLAISPLKALINDQYARLEEMCEPLELPVHRWHGDVAGNRKKKVLDGAGGLLLITPESLEALFIRNGPKVARLFANLDYVLIDELHAFIGVERGKQLQSLLHRTELAIRRRVPRLALSATLGDMKMAAAFLRPGEHDRATIIESRANRHAVALQIRGYRESDPQLSAKQAAAAAREGHEVSLEQVVDGHDVEIADDLWRLLRGGRHITFCNARRQVELYCDLLRARSEKLRVPHEFWPHHGSLSKQLREDAEAALKDTTRPSTIVATSTLELGIDVGEVETIAQVDAPSSVAAMRQRLGRSGRSEDAASTLRMFISEPEITADTPPQDTLRTSLVQATAMVRLLIEKWNEPPDPDALHLSTLVQQTLSLIAQHGGVSAADAWSALCRTGPFSAVDQELFARLLRSLGHNDLLVQTHDGQLVLGLTGEKIVNHYDFYAAFAAAEEYRLVHGNTTLGTLPVDVPLLQGMHLIFGGRRWVVIDVDNDRKVVLVESSPGGRVPPFGGNKPWVHDRIRREMLAVYRDTDEPAYLDAPGLDLLAEARDWFHRHELDTRTALTWGDATLLFPWVGDRALTTLMLQLAATGVKADVEDVAIYVEEDLATTRQLLADIERQGPADATVLAASVENLETAKHHHWLDRPLLVADYASGRLDTHGAHRAAAALLAGWPAR